MAAGRKKRRGLSQAAWDDLLTTPGAPTEAEMRDLAGKLRRAPLGLPDELPREVRAKLFWLLVWLINLKPADPQQVKTERWELVRHGLDLFGDFKQACLYASRMALGPCGGVGPDQMGVNYMEMQKTLPKEKRRPRTYKRRPPVSKLLAHWVNVPGEYVDCEAELPPEELD